MTKLGKKLIAAANEGIAIARGKADPAGYRLHVPRKIDVKAMRRMFGMTQETFGLRCGLTLVAMALVALALVVLALVVALAILALVTLTLLVLALLVLVRTARAPGRRATGLGGPIFETEPFPSLGPAARAARADIADRYK
jgi:Flp pilus assembly protein TadB